MGRIKHNAIIVTDDSARIEEYRQRAIEIFNKHFSWDENNPVDYGNQIVSTLIPSLINGYLSFFIAPDGSKEGWKDSNAGDEARKEFLDYLKSLSSYDRPDYVEIYYGGDQTELEGIERSAYRDFEDQY